MGVGGEMDGVWRLRQELLRCLRKTLHKLRIRYADERRHLNPLGSWMHMCLGAGDVKTKQPRALTAPDQ